MSVAINYEEVSKELALKVANLEFQLESYRNLSVQLEKELKKQTGPVKNESAPIPSSEPAYEEGQNE